MTTKVATWHVSVELSSNCRTPSSTTTSPSTRPLTTSQLHQLCHPHPPQSPSNRLARLARPRSLTRLSCVTTCSLAASARRRITTCTPVLSILTPPSLLPPSQDRLSILRFPGAPAATQPLYRRPRVTASRPGPRSNRKCFIHTHVRRE